MNDISVQGLVKSFGQDKNILDGLSFNVESGEHIGILGKNGAGKTTLFRLLTGEILPDSGSTIISSGKRIGLISQIPVYPEDFTVEDVLEKAHERIFYLEAQMKELADGMSKDASEDSLRKYDAAAAEYERLGGYTALAERNRIANGLEISEKMRLQLFSKLSGGEKTRVNLSRLIIEDTDILLLDEPTNHLDLRATEWLEEYIAKFNGTVLIISHDRYFLDRTVSRCIEIKEGKAEFYSGNYSFYAVEKLRRYNEQLKQCEINRSKIDQLNESADRLHLWAFMGNDALHKRAFSIERRIERLSKTERPKAERGLKVKFKQRQFTGDEVLVIDGVSKSFDKRNLFSDVELFVEGAERIALVGDNGSGKSTLIKLIMREEEPESGVVRIGPSVKTAYLPQIIEFEHPGLSLLDTLLYSDKCTAQQARDQLAGFHFMGEDVFKPVSALSGGEQSRLRLCMLMNSQVNFLILDEPTNHLDINNREWIEEALETYDEALLFVSHDRYFIEKFASRIWALEDGKIIDFRGSYAQYTEYKNRSEEAKRREAAISKKARAADRPKADTQPSYNKLLSNIEREVEKTEYELSVLDDEYLEYSSDYIKLIELDDKISVLKIKLDELYEEWGRLADSQ